MYRHWMLLAFLLLPDAAVQSADDSGFSPCEIGNSDSTGLISAQCKTIAVAENPQNPGGKQIQLHVAWLPARSSDQRADPLTILAGGPGQSASASFPAVAQAFSKIRDQRDIYLIDQRGTGQSNRLDCPQSTQQSDPFAFDPQALEAQSRACLDALDSDPRFYTTSVAVRDLEQVRTAFGIGQWNIYGISYGSRVGLHYLRQYPAQLRTLILDGVVPPGVSLGESIAFEAQRALDLLLQRCANSEDCHRRFPNLRYSTETLLSALRKSPRFIQFENFNTGKQTEMHFSLHHLTLTLRMLTYTSHGVAILPVLLTDAEKNNNYAPLARQAYLQAEKLAQSLASGMHNAVICTEDQPYVTIDDELLERLSHTYLGSTPVRALQSSCKHWSAGVIDENFRTPVKSAKPVLILSGEADPVTPPAYGDAVAEHLPNALHIVNPGQGHMQAALGCMPGVMLNFIERGNTRDVDYGCLERLQPRPFFIDANGPAP